MEPLALTALAEALAQGDFSDLPTVELMADDELPGARSHFSESRRLSGTGRIGHSIIVGRVFSNHRNIVRRLPGYSGISPIPDRSLTQRIVRISPITTVEEAG